MMSGRGLRIATLFLPALLVALCSESDQLVHAAAPALIVMWVVMMGSLVMRFSEGIYTRRGDGPSPWACVDVLTATGASMMWVAVGALLAADAIGWASLTVIGILGLGTVCVTVTWSALVAGGPAPWRRATISREILPERSVEGDPLREEVRLTGVTIATGMRLFAIGRPMPHGATSRYAVGADGSGAEIRFESELGPALRGEHRAPPLALWLADVLGLTRTPVIHRGEATFSVMPRPAAVDGVRDLLGTGGDDMMTRPTHRLPTEGSFRIREYVAGDDTRRIHWVRSLQQDRLIVRLPDEIPLAAPVVRLVLDTELAGSDLLTCRAVDELLDALVRVWLGIAKSLVASGTRVILVGAGEREGLACPVVRTVTSWPSREALRLGARAGWQNSLALERMLDGGAGPAVSAAGWRGGSIDDASAKQIVVTCRRRRVPNAASIAWVIVPEAEWTSAEPALPPRSAATLPFPSGSAENRPDRRRRELLRIARMWHDRALFSQVVCWNDPAVLAGAYVARRKQDRVTLAVML